jgi:hypothetical protein
MVSNRMGLKENRVGFRGLTRISCTLFCTGLRMRLSSRKAARGSLVPPSCTGNPGTVLGHSQYSQSSLRSLWPSRIKGVGRVPQVRQSVPGPKMICFNCFSYPRPGFAGQHRKELWWASPVFLNPRTLGRTWGTRPTPIDPALTQTPAGLVSAGMYTQNCVLGFFSLLSAGVEVKGLVVRDHRVAFCLPGG